MSPWLRRSVAFVLLVALGCGGAASSVPQPVSDEEKLKQEQKALNEARQKEWGKTK